MREPTVIASAPKAFLEFAVARGADRRTVLRRAGVEPADLADADARVPVVRYVAMMEAAIDLCREPALALLYGDEVPAEDLTILPLVAISGRDAEDAREKTNRYAPLALDDGEDRESLELVRLGGKVGLKLASPLYARYRVLTESGVARSVSGARRMMKALGGRAADVAFPDAIHFTYAEPAHRDAYDRVFGVALTFESDMNAIVVDPAFLSLSMPKPFPAAAATLTERAEQLLARLRGPASTQAAVEDALLRGLEHGRVGMEEIARQLGLSRATLLRRLKAEGVTFGAVLERLRRARAVRYLTEEKLTVRQTAQLVGFSDAAAFSRAFKRWTGKSPKRAERD
ncbi:MAG TPA: AraC family transcriptional regulator ligand-binding domain-containing protein [Candidatus Polarisedimenticolaceae bacterium]|nr:AraC family transcriptional regulator ligand-binding domain-containing protein [Candidatus Polarisedimenticolaceae bacterium]